MAFIIFDGLSGQFKMSLNLAFSQASPTILIFPTPHVLAEALRLGYGRRNRGQSMLHIIEPPSQHEQIEKCSGILPTASSWDCTLNRVCHLTKL